LARVESTGTRGDRSINSLCSRQLLTISSLLKKKKRNPEVIDKEGDEDGDVKTKEKWFENKKKMEQR